jgi:hypothetical protein
MRRRAEQPGNLKSTSQQTVKTEGQTFVIQPTNPEVGLRGRIRSVDRLWSPRGRLSVLGSVSGTLSRGARACVWPGHRDRALRLGVGPVGRGLARRQVALRPSCLHRPPSDFPSRYLSRTRQLRAPADFMASRRTLRPASTGAFHAHPATFHADSGAFHGFDNGGVARAFADRGRASFHGGFHAGGFHGGGRR